MGVLRRVNQHDAILVEEALVAFNQDGERAVRYLNYCLLCSSPQGGPHAKVAPWLFSLVGLVALASAATAEEVGTSAVPFEIAPRKASSTVRNPVIQGRPVDWCLVPTKQCGKPAADRYCQMKRLGRALQFEGARSNQRTIILGTNELCDTRRFSHCDQFSRIVCSGGGNL